MKKKMNDTNKRFRKNLHAGKGDSFNDKGMTPISQLSHLLGSSMNWRR
jgi:hypothetical protein